MLQASVVEKQWPAALKDAQLDKIDLLILAALQKHGRISKSALASQVNLSPSACFERFSRLEKRQVISSYHAMVNLRSLVQIEVFVTQITLKTHFAADFRRFEAFVKKIPEIIECQALAGGIDYIIKVVAPNVESYEELMQQMLDAEINIEKYFTYLVTKDIKSLPQYEVSNLL